MGGGEPHFFEFWIRNALFLPKQPILMILDPGEPARCVIVCDWEDGR